MRFRVAVAPAIYSLAYRSGLSRHRARRRKEPRILMFHGVGGADYPLAVFRAQMEYLKSALPVVPLTGLVPTHRWGEREAGEREAEAQVALTFDDGLRSNFTLAYPILRDLGLPATFYLCSDLIEGRQWLWNHEARARLRTLSVERRQHFAPDLKSECGDTETIVEWMKTLPLKVRYEVDERIREATPRFAPDAALVEECEMMRWEDVRLLPPDLITIGSHTRRHPCLPALEESELHLEIEGSREDLERRLGRSIDSFAYPNGLQTPRVVQIVRETYRSAVTTTPGFVHSGDDPYLLPRIPVPRSLPALAWRLHKTGE